MLYRYSEVFRSLIMAADLALVATAWLAAYWIRFHAGLPAPRGIPALRPYVEALAVILPLWFILFRQRGLYEPRRSTAILSEVGELLRVTAVGVTVLVAISFFARSYYYSRGVVAIFSVLCPTMILALRTTLRLGLRGLRRRGYNLRYVLVVGAGPLATEAITRIRAHPEAGLRIRGVLAARPLSGARQTVAGMDVVGSYADLKRLLGEARVDQVLIAVPREEGDALEKVLADLDDEMVSVKLVPDLLDVLSLRRSVEDLDGLPVINLRDTPMVGWAAVQKRAFDIVLAGVAFVLAAPLCALVAAAVALTSGLPILYRQKRMGLDGRVFTMYKFRTMCADAEEGGPAWTRPDDPRRTRLGAWLRRFSADELPQLWNVLRGDMSLVGPRPERPVFIEEFRREIPGYMLRHKVRSGLTGWAQVHGWRGDTCLHQRIDHDIYYIQNWSLGLDVRILLMTLWRSLTQRNAY